MSALAVAGRPRRSAVRSAANVVVGLAVGTITGVLGTLAHLVQLDVGQLVLPAGVALALGLVLAADLALLTAVPSAIAALGDAVGRALVVLAVLRTGPGGDVALLGSWPSEVWILVSVLLPAFAGPPLATLAAIRRGRSAAAVGEIGTARGRTTLGRRRQWPGGPDAAPRQPPRTR